METFTCFLFFSTFLMMSNCGYAEVPNTISFQVILQDSQGNNLSGTHTLTVKLFNVETVVKVSWLIITKRND